MPGAEPILGGSADPPAPLTGAADAWVAAMRAGAFDVAWSITDRDVMQLRAGGAPRHAGPRHLQRIWRGEPLAGRILVRCYHGLGDTIQFARFLAALRRRVDEVILWCQPELMPVMASVAGVDRALALHDGDPGVAYDAEIEIMELAHALRVSRREIAGGVPYIRCGSGRSGSLSRAAGAPLRVGLVWQAGTWDERRSIRPAELSKLAGMAGVELLSLQPGPAAAQEAQLIPARDASTPHLGELAARLCRLDLVLTVDTMVAHLAGALGLPTWTLLHSDCDWRWPEHGERTIWYPSMRLFHQDRPGEWTGAIERVRARLARMASSARDRRAGLRGQRGALRPVGRLD